VKALLLAILLPAAAWAERPAHWAEPVPSGTVQNFYRVTGDLYRCAQPTPAALRELEKIGIRTVINLRTLHADPAPAGASLLRLEQIKMQPWHLDEDDVVRVLALLRQKDRGPFLIHCQHGADRTGAIIALHRIIDLGWKKEDAIAEMRDGGFGFHKIWLNLTHYFAHLDAADITRLRARVDELARKGA
jgi:protein tyrosine phosphatase (PTP) superfamily phosphohydrolase (DUF442 family)